MLKEIKYVSAQEAVKVVKSGDHIHLSSVASAPKILIDALCARGEAGELKDVRIHHLHTEGEAPYADPKFNSVFFHQGFFVDQMSASQSRQDTPIIFRYSLARPRSFTEAERSHAMWR